MDDVQKRSQESKDATGANKARDCEETNNRTQQEEEVVQGGRDVS